MIEINIAKEFGIETGARTYADGPKSGEEFFDKLLKPRYEQAKAEGKQLRVILDGTEGLASSFLNESFGRLGKAFGPEDLKNRLVLISNEMPKYITKIQEAIDESDTR
jgi:hypothetical protein